MRLPIRFAVVVLLGCGRMLAAEPLPLEAYGNLPSVSQLAISPSGQRVALRRTTSEYDIVAVIDLTTSENIGAVRVDEIKPRELFFATENDLVLIVSKTARTFRVIGPWEASAAFVFDIEKGAVEELLKRYNRLYPIQSGLGRIVGQSADRSKLYMPAFLGQRSTVPTYGLLEVDVKSARTRLIDGGRRDTIDWFVDDQGRPIAEEVYDQGRNIHEVYSHVSGERKLIFQEQSPIPTFRLDGVSPDGQALYFASYRSGSDYLVYYKMNLHDGNVIGPMFERDGASIESAVTDINRVLYGVKYRGFKPSYRFIDDELDARVTGLLSRNSGTAMSIVGWTENFAQFLIYGSGAWLSGAWYLGADGVAPIGRIAYARPEITHEHVVPTAIIEYAARDGLIIPALVTVSDAVREAGNAPLVVLPHGGPASFDRFEFDWLTQYLASRGMVVLQPQFRGSSGFGITFEEQGRGEWGGKMSTDLDDGALRLIEDGLADPERVCIVGASYGGYAALAAATFSDFDYKCVVSIAGVSDLSKMLSHATRTAGRGHWVVDYWEDQFGAGKRDDELLDAISPARFAESVKAPVLLLHGRDDTVVPIDQSNTMHKALKRAKKPVEYIKLKGEDHYLSESATRLATLKAIDQFLKLHL